MGLGTGQPHHPGGGGHLTSWTSISQGQCPCGDGVVWLVMDISTVRSGGS